MRIFFSVGEPSGDLHASNLIKRLKAECSDLQAVGFGGPKMQSAGCELVYDLTQLAVMFLGEVIRNLRFFFKLIGQADDYFANHKVDAVVLIDYPGFNWWIARKAKKHKIPVFYYGVPQMWAWAPWRIKKIRKFVDHVICKLPFEPQWFQERGCQAFYVGHPYFDQLQEQSLDQAFIGDAQTNESRPIVLLLPGSRNAEITENLDTLLRSSAKIRQAVSNVKLVVSCLNAKHAEMCREQCEQHGVELYAERTQEWMSMASCCIACSGSVSLELLYHRVPTVIVYKISWLKSMIKNVMLRCKFITLTNLMNCSDIRRSSWKSYDPDEIGAEPTIMPEYLSSRDRTDSIAKRVVHWLSFEESRAANIKQLDELALRYVKPGATGRAASYIIANLQKVEERRNDEIRKAA